MSRNSLPQPRPEVRPAEEKVGVAAARGPRGEAEDQGQDVGQEGLGVEGAAAAGDREGRNISNWNLTTWSSVVSDTGSPILNSVLLAQLKSSQSRIQQEGQKKVSYCNNQIIKLKLFKGIYK